MIACAPFTSNFSTVYKYKNIEIHPILAFVDYHAPIHVDVDLLAWC